MDILEQCQTWRKQNKRKLIINLIESLPEEQRTALVDSELAIAYSEQIQVNPIRAQDILDLKKAVALLKKHEAELGETFNWNFRLGYAYFYLEQHDLSIKYMQNALLLNTDEPDDDCIKDDVEYFINCSKQGINVPIITCSFLDRVKLTWEEFKQRRSHIEDLINTNEHDLAIALLEECFHVLFEDINFELGIKDKAYEIIFPTECDLATTLQLKTFIAHVPSKLKKHWSFIIGRPDDTNLIIDNGAAKLTSQDFMVYSFDIGNNRYDLKIIAPKLKQLTSTDEQAQKLAFYFIASTLGEVNYLNHIAGLELLNKEANIKDLSDYDQGCTLDNFILKLKEQGLKLNNDVKLLPDSCLKEYQHATPYGNEMCSRFDIDHGMSSLLGLHIEFLNEESSLYNSFYHNGAIPVFICFELTNSPKSSSLHITDSQLEKMVATIRNKTAAVASIVGYASGLNYGYIDCIAWDVQKFLACIDYYFNQNDKIKSAACQAFNQSDSYVRLKPHESDSAENGIAGFASWDALKELIENEEYEQVYQTLVKAPVAKINFESDLKLIHLCIFILEQLYEEFYSEDHNDPELKLFFSKIIKYCEELLGYYQQSESNNPQWLLFYAILSHNKIEMKEAFNALKKIIALDPDNEAAQALIQAYKLDRCIERTQEKVQGFSDQEMEHYHHFSAIVLLKKPIEDFEKFNKLFKQQLPDYYQNFAILLGTDDCKTFFNQDLCYLTINYNHFTFPIGPDYFEGEYEKYQIMCKQQTAILIECTVASDSSLKETAIFFNKYLESLFKLDEVLGVFINDDLKTKVDFHIPAHLSLQDQYFTAADNILGIVCYIDEHDNRHYICSSGFTSFGFHEVEICLEDYPGHDEETVCALLNTTMFLQLSNKLELKLGKVIPFVEDYTIKATPRATFMGFDAWYITIQKSEKSAKKRPAKSSTKRSTKSSKKRPAQNSQQRTKLIQLKVFILTKRPHG